MRCCFLFWAPFFVFLLNSSIFCNSIDHETDDTTELHVPRNDTKIDKTQDYEVVDDIKINTKKVDKSLTRPSLKLQNITNYQIEIVFLIIFNLLIIAYSYGTYLNGVIGLKWGRAYIRELSKHFSHIGMPNLKNKSIAKLDDRTYALWCTGSTFCKGMLLEFILIPRQSIIEIVSALIWGSFDDYMKVTVFFENNVETSIILIGKNAHLKKNEAMTTYAAFCKKRNLPNTFQTKFGSKNLQSLQCLSYYAEISSFFDTIILDTLGKLVKTHHEMLCYTLYSDLSVDEEGKKLKLPEDQSDLGHKLFVYQKTLTNDRTSPISKLLTYSNIFLVDDVGIIVELAKKLSSKYYGYSKDGLTRMQKNRTDLTLKNFQSCHEKRKELGMKLKDKKVKEENMRIMSTTDPDLQLKLQAKKLKREQREKNRKYKKSNVKMVVA